MQLVRVFALFDSFCAASHCHAARGCSKHRWRMLQIRSACCAQCYEICRWLLRVMGTQWARSSRTSHASAANFASRHQGWRGEETVERLCCTNIAIFGLDFLSASASASSVCLSTRRALRGLWPRVSPPLLPPQLLRIPTVYSASPCWVCPGFKISYRT